MFCRPAEKKKMEKDFDKKMKRPIITEKLQATQLSRKRDDSSIETFFVGIFVLKGLCHKLGRIASILRPLLSA